MTDQILLSDDVFLLGNIASLSVIMGHGAEALPILDLLEKERPMNAGSCIMRAMHLYSIGKTQEAIDYLGQSNAFEAEVNKDEAIAIFIFLLSRNDQTEDAVLLARASLSGGSELSASARQSIEQILSDCEAQS